MQSSAVTAPLGPRFAAAATTTPTPPTIRAPAAAIAMYSSGERRLGWVDMASRAGGSRPLGGGTEGC